MNTITTINASEIMTREVVCVSPSQKLVDVKHIFEKKKFHHHIPVVENGRLEGMVSLIDYMRAIGNASLEDTDDVYQNKEVKDIMSIHPITKSPDTSLKEIAQEFSKGEVHAIVIMDNGKVFGIISTTDLINYLLKE